MLSQITRTLSRTTTSYNNHLRKNLSKLLLSNQQFSTIVPGVGKGKTSTGLHTHEQLIDMVQDLQHLNSQILVNLQSLDPTQHKAYIVNTGIVARQRMDIVSALIPQLKKNPNKVGKVVKRIVDEINFGSNLGVLIQQARDELKKMDGRIANF